MSHRVNLWGWINLYWDAISSRYNFLKKKIENHSNWQNRIIMNSIEKLFQKKDKNLLSIYFTCGYPKLNDTAQVISELEKSGVDFIEVGLPYSDPLADGPTIQDSSQKALENGVNLDVIFEQLLVIKETNKTPLVLMGYLNQMLKYGEDKFCQKVVDCGIDTLILPDLPMIEFENHYKDLFEKYGLTNVFLITPHTSDERIRKIDSYSSIYLCCSFCIYYRCKRRYF